VSVALHGHFTKVHKIMLLVPVYRLNGDLVCTCKIHLKHNSCRTYLTSMFNIPTCYAMCGKYTDCMVPDFSIQPPVHLYTTMAMTHGNAHSYAKSIM